MLSKKYFLLISFIILISINLMLIFNDIYIIKNYNHKCFDAKCDICNTIQKIKNNDFKFLTDTIKFNFTFIPLLIIFSIINKSNYLICKLTLVKLKVRMDN